MLIRKAIKIIGFISLPFVLGGATYYVNGRPVYVEDSQQDYYDSEIYSRPIIINNGPTIIINRPGSNTPKPPDNPNYNAGEQKLPNNGINRPGTPYLSGDGSVRNN